MKPALPQHQMTSARTLLGLPFSDPKFFVIVFSLLGASLSLFASFVTPSTQHQFFGVILLVVGFVFALNVVMLWVSQDLRLAIWLLLATMLVVLLTILITGGIAGTGIFWFFAMPHAAFYLTGRRQGLGWMAALFLSIFGTMLLARTGLVTLAFSYITMYQMLLALLVVTLGIYLYQFSREEAENAKQQTEQDLQEYLDHMPTFNSKIAPDGTILFANKTVRNNSPKGQSVVGRNFLNSEWWYVDQASKETVTAYFERAVGGETVIFEAPFKIAMHQGLTEFVFRVTLLPVRKAGKLQYILLEASNVDAEHKIDEAKSELIALASHQLRTPISAIAWFAEMLLSGDTGKLSSEQQERIAQIYQSNQRMAAIVDDMLLVSQLELDELSVRPEPLDLATMAKKILQAQVLAQRTDKKLRLKETYEPLAKVQVDSQLMKVILRNLISNAVKYTPDGGTVAVTINTSKEKLHPQSAGSIRIIVQDTGYGIPRAAQQYIFKKLYRAQNVKQRNTDGTGLGLFIVKNALQQVGGQIAFTSTEGKGSKFVVLFPIEGMRPHQIQKEQRTR